MKEIAGSKCEDLPDKVLMMEVMEFGSCPERDEPIERDGEIVAGMSVNDLRNPDDHPDPHLDHVCSEEDGREDGSQSKDHGL